VARSNPKGTRKNLDELGVSLDSLGDAVVATDTGGRITRLNPVAEAFRDGNQEKRVERALRHLAAIVESSENAILSKTLEGVVTSWNPGAERIFGYKAHEMIGTPMARLIPADRLEEEPQILARLKNGERVDHFETVRVAKDGRRLPVSVTISPIKDAAGKIVGASTIVLDLTKQHQAEERHNSERLRGEQQLQIVNQELQKAKLVADAANLAKSRFLANLSHEIRTPMNAILGYTQLMLRDPNLGAEAKGNLNVINRSGEHLLSLINSVLDMSKIEAGRAELRPSAFSARRLVDNLANMFRLRAGAKGLQFEVSLQGESLPHLMGDEGKINQALINLLGNAIKFTDRGGVKLDVTLEPSGGHQVWLSACVEDTGPGISKQDAEQLFQPFTQSKGSLNTSEGTGLGLAISREHARLMRGDLTLTSVPGRGSIFRFRVPLERAEVKAAIVRSSARRIIGLQAGQEIPKIMVVDDQFENRDWLVKLLGLVGISAQSAVDGEASIQRWEEWNPDLILMDVHMPVMDGLEATRRIKATPRGAKTIIIALTASTLENERLATFESGVDDFIAKPCDEHELLAKLGRHLHLAYRYDESAGHDHEPTDGTPALSVEKLRKLPRDLLEKLRQATLKGNKRLMDALILEIGQKGSAESTDALRRLIDSYDYDYLAESLEEACR
jgi:PAS domain S-box-containing protein